MSFCFLGGKNGGSGGGKFASSDSSVGESSLSSGERDSWIITLIFEFIKLLFLIMVFIKSVNLIFLNKK